MRFTLKLILILGIFVILSTVYADAPKVVRAYLGVYEYNGTYQDPLGNTFLKVSRHIMDNIIITLF